MATRVVRSLRRNAILAHRDSPTEHWGPSKRASTLWQSGPVKSGPDWVISRTFHDSQGAISGCFFLYFHQGTALNRPRPFRLGLVTAPSVGQHAAEVVGTLRPPDSRTPRGTQSGINTMTTAGRVPGTQLLLHCRTLGSCWPLREAGLWQHVPHTPLQRRQQGRPAWSVFSQLA